ncbi:hypothetical protein chiPu_0005269 [Chiloscyllium punctatum]|uniref:Uncharacterized protein n=1 Tax=Chiloscyllium punctatum TaxID=137246 RepID=A0A401S8W5_CHIPU|nr:hypothetical protein [Chiloscyllium punctatum]
MSYYNDEPRYTIEQIDLLQRLRRSGMTKHEIIHALETMERLDQEQNEKFVRRPNYSSNYGNNVSASSSTASAATQTQSLAQSPSPSNSYDTSPPPYNASHTGRESTANERLVASGTLSPRYQNSGSQRSYSFDTGDDDADLEEKVEEYMRRDSNAVKEEIKAFLANRRISQAVVGQVTGISQSYISQWLLQQGLDMSEPKKRAFYRWYLLEKNSPGRQERFLLFKTASSALTGPVFRELATDGDSVNFEEYMMSVICCISKCIDDVTMSKTVTSRHNQKPWMTAKVCALVRIRDSAFRADDKADLTTTWAIKEAKCAHVQRIHSLFQDSGNTQSMWKGVQAITNHRTASPACAGDANLSDELINIYARVRVTKGLGSEEVPQVLYFGENQYPDEAKREEIANACNTVIQKPGKKLSEFERVTPLKVYNWFANRRKEMKRRANIEAAILESHGIDVQSPGGHSNSDDIEGNDYCEQDENTSHSDHQQDPISLAVEMAAVNHSVLALASQGGSEIKTEAIDDD